jgi:hypothetical protein
MFVEHQSTSGAKIWLAPVLHKSSTALLFPYGNYGVHSISPGEKRTITWSLEAKYTSRNTQKTLQVLKPWNSVPRPVIVVTSVISI